ncbi:BCD family MFS transporter [Myxacorys almedinensis]|uniref:MFS transporter n=1 Tax=Myxacorys almedinensis A TaxID=2690445 RepID=A0A8J7Z375_9CYAN|nr:BCD family MFS transporter [Myxacorys almedinensis]NDJ15688.1 MFS transporter [Myxacorys almedinensis A]
METNNFSDASSGDRGVTLPRVGIVTMIRLGLFQMGLGMMSVLVFGVLNRVLIRELGVPATIATVILALTLFVAPTRVVFGQLSDTKPIWGLHRTNYVLIGAGSLVTLAYLSVQVMWQAGASLQATGWTVQTYGWLGVLAVMFGLYGIAVGACSTPFATLLVDVTEEEDRSKIVAIDWSMLIGGTIIGAIAIGVLLRQVAIDASIETIRAGVNRLFVIVPLVVFGLAWVATWGVERKYSRFAARTVAFNPEGKLSLKRAWRILTASRQTRLFFTFLVAMTMGLFMQDPVLETYGGDVFEMTLGETASLNAFWGTGTVVGIMLAGFFMSPRIGKRRTAKWGCILTAASLVWVILAGFTANPKALQMALLIFGLASGVTTTGAITLMLDLTAAETAGTFIGAWGLSQALSKGLSTVIGGATLDLGKRLTTNLVVAYGLVFTLQACCMVAAVGLLSRVSVQEFRANAKDAIAAVLNHEGD